LFSANQRKFNFL